jgi:ABC-type amino acid transport substrate-binding protein
MRGKTFARSRLLLSLGVLFCLASFAFAETTLERVRRTGELRIGTDATYPPFETAEGDQFTGFDIDIANAIARQLGVRAVYRNASFDGIFPALQNGTFDMVISRSRSRRNAAPRCCFRTRITMRDNCS